MLAFEPFFDPEMEYENFEYPEEMANIKNKLSKYGKLNISPMNLEKAWYAFSETWDAQFLVVDDDTVKDFLEWIKDRTVEDITRMNYYGEDIGRDYMPWLVSDKYEEYKESLNKT